jgi:arylsulfatase A-like enzyme
MRGAVNRRRVLVGLVAMAMALAGTLWVGLGNRGPSVLLITVDSLRPDYLSCYGGTHGTTPQIDALAGQGVRFTEAVCDVPWTRASMASTMTGRYAARHHLRTPYQRLADDQPTMAEAFRRAGYLTGAVVSTFDLDHIFELDRGFETYDDYCDAPIVQVSRARPLHLASIFVGDPNQERGLRRAKLRGRSRRDDQRTTDTAVGWLRRVGARRFFLWVHYFGAHERWPIGADLPLVIEQYVPAVATADVQVGRLLRSLDELGLADNTLVVLHGDHGQSLLDRGGFGHGHNLYEPNLRVPLIMRWPGHLPAGRPVGGLARLVDVFPTVNELAGVTPPRAIDGQSLVESIRKGQGPTDAQSYCETFLSATIPASEVVAGPDGQPVRLGFVRRGIRDARWKYLRNEPTPLLDAPEPLPDSLRRTLASEELYDLQEDAGEQHNVIEEHATLAADLRARVDRYRDR